MAQVDYTVAQTLTRNQARLVEFSLRRETDGAGQFTGNVVVSGVVQVGHFTGGVFTENTRVAFSDTRTLAQVASFYGAPTLSTMETKTLERLQALGLLPAGVVT